MLNAQNHVVARFSVCCKLPMDEPQRRRILKIRVEPVIGKDSIAKVSRNKPPAMIEIHSVTFNESSDLTPMANRTHHVFPNA